MTYPKSTVQEALAYLEAGYAIKDIADALGVSAGCVAHWRRKAFGVSRTQRPHPVQYPMETVRLALGLAYGNHGFSLDEVAVMLGVAAPTISNWKKRYIEGGIMEIPEIDPKDIKHLSAKDMDNMSEEELRRYVHELEVKTYVLEGTVKILKAEGIEKLSNDEKAALIDARPQNITVTELLEILAFSSSSYYYCKSKPEHIDRYVEARRAIKEEFELVKGSRGYRYIRQRLRSRDVPIVVSGKKVRALMAEEGCVVAYAKRGRRYSSYAGEISVAPENIVARDFHADRPNELWITDITEFKIPAGKVYLSPVVDCFDGMPVSWCAGTSPNAQLANKSLAKACKLLDSDEHPICHSDRGSHYRWPGWIKLCKRYGLVRSMSQKGCSPDNSAMEGFFGRIKNEFFYYRDWEGVSIDEFITQLDDYMRYYRDERMKESLGWMSPMQYRKSLGLSA